MKRGLITWDREALPPSVFEARLKAARRPLLDRKLPALVVYSDVARSNQARYLTNFMPYWNRSLAVIPREGPPVLLCALSPRVYPWIKSVTTFDEIRPAPKLVEALTALCTERGWKKVGVLDLPQMIHEVIEPLRRTGLGLVDVSSDDALDNAVDDAELAVRRRTAQLAREVLEANLSKGSGGTDYQLTGALERAFRRAGAEDLVVLISSGQTAPKPAHGETLGDGYSVAIALEMSGHWVKVARPFGFGDAWRRAFRLALEDSVPREGMRVSFEDLSGSHAWAVTNRCDLSLSSIYAVHVEHVVEGHRWFYGDSCIGGQAL